MKSVAVSWFEIPVSNMDRAVSFYQKVFDCELQIQRMGDFEMAWFPWQESEGGASGSLVYHAQFYAPSSQAGALIYLSSTDCSVELALVEEAGGKVLIPKRQISPEIGFMGVFLDSEGNRIALHSQA